MSDVPLSQIREAVRLYARTLEDYYSMPDEWFQEPHNRSYWGDVDIAKAAFIDILGDGSGEEGKLPHPFSSEWDERDLSPTGKKMWKLQDIACSRCHTRPGTTTGR